MTDDKTKELPKVGSTSKKNPTPDGKKKKQKKVKGPFHKQRIFATILIVITSIGLLGVTGVGVYAFQQIKKAPAIDANQFNSDNSSTLLDKDGNVFYTAGLKKRDNVTYSELSTPLIDAFVAAEDSRFFTHNGFDVPRFTRAALNNLATSVKTGSFSFAEGGSTFTMQLIKNTYYVEDGSGGAEGGASGIPRKIQEIFLAQKIEAEGIVSKQLILELYLNKIDFGVGSNILGIEKSAQAYFGKSASDLNLVESAFMAGVINAPFKNSPYRSIEKANIATQRVLSNMLQHGYITQEERDIAANVRIEDLLVEPDGAITGDLPYQAFVDAVVAEVFELTGEKPDSGNMIVHTTLDPTVQGAIDVVQNREISYLDYGADNDIQAASTVMNNTTGEILGFFGRYDYNAELLTNIAITGGHSPGSTLKPIVSYAPAYEYLGWASDHIIVDEPIYNVNFKTLNNYDGRYLGEIDLNYAIGDSRNVPAVKAYQQVYELIGHEGYVAYLNNLGLNVASSDFQQSYAIGSDPFTVSTTQIAGATASIFNNGQYIKPHTVLKIEYTDGREPYVPDHTPVQAMSSGAAYLTSRGMKYVVDSGMNSFINPIRKSYTTFAKTGTNAYDDTTADKVGVPRGSEKDRLLTTSTDQFTISTWVGWEKNHSKAYFSQAERQTNFPGKFNGYILDILAENYGTGKDISKPSDVVELTHIKGPFPYQAPLADMNQDLVSTGWILSKYAKLTDATPQELQALADQKVETSSNGNTLKFKVTMSEYPDKEKLTVATEELVMNDPNGGTVTGKRVYDESWIYGAVRYKTELRVNGSPVKEILSETNVMELDYAVSSATTDIQLCSYYTFDKAQSRKSNEKCTPISADQIPTESAPNFIGEDVGVFQDWSRNKGLDITTEYRLSQDPFDTVISMNPNLSGTTKRANELKNLKVTVTLSDKEAVTGGTVSDFRNQFGDYLNISFPSGTTNNSIITGFKFDSLEVTSFKLSERRGLKVELSVKQAD